jgi:poly-gamma-glutamate synthesis protein (capsule biosynthesis protein)
MRSRPQLLSLALLLVLGCGSEPAESSPVTTSPPETTEVPPTPSPPDDPAPAAGPSRTTVFAAGDVYLGGHVKGRVKEHGPEHPFVHLEDTIESHDLAFANLEAPISSRGTRINDTKKPLFRISKEDALPLTHSGLDVMAVANNHTMDFLEESFVDTLETMEEFGIATVGGGLTRKQAETPYIYQHGNNRIAILAYNRIMMTQMAVNAHRPGMNAFIVEKVIEDIQQIPEDTVVLVSVHWGDQYVEYPLPRHVKAARKMIEAGADAILGHHPHCPQTVEVHQGKPIFYSLGNFVFGVNPPKGRHNIAASLVIEDGAITEAHVLPVHGKFKACDYSPHFLQGDEARKVIENLAHLSDGKATITFADDRGTLDLHQ